MRSYNHNLRNNICITTFYSTTIVLLFFVSYNTCITNGWSGQDITSLPINWSSCIQIFSKLQKIFLNSFYFFLRQTNTLRLQEIKKEFHLLTMIAEERLTRPPMSISPISSIRIDSSLKTRGARNSFVSSSALQVTH